MRRKVLQYRIISKDRRFKDKVVLIPRIRLLPNAETLPVPLKRLQFLVRLAFAMTINKSQGQLVEHVGINLQISVLLEGWRAAITVGTNDGPLTGLSNR